jgi:hypothetical protein
MFDKVLEIKNFVEKNAFEVVFVLCLLFLLMGGIYHWIRGKKGSWSTHYFYDEMLIQHRTTEDKKQKESKGETECRRVLESIFQRKFKKVRPQFLKNPVTGGTNNLELDCYNEELGVAVEYDGRQHAEYTPYFHKNKEAFYNQQYRDYMKQQMCKENNIKLIKVPHTVKINKIEEFLIRELRTQNLL